jgi:hypothetical protein
MISDLAFILDLLSVSSRLESRAMLPNSLAL